MKKIIKLILPPLMWNAISFLKQKKFGWSGNFATWNEASRHSEGYDQDNILLKVRDSLLKVKSGEATYERDSVIFDEIQYSWPLLSGLLLAATKGSGKLSVIDFGGSLGSTYFQNKKFLDKIQEVSWNVIEQKPFVQVGRKEFSGGQLRFYEDMESCFCDVTPNVLVLSSVLQYLEDPYEFLKSALARRFEFVIIDLTGFSSNDEDRLTVQTVDPKIYTASYPCWMFSESRLIECFAGSYELVEKFQCMSDLKIYLDISTHATYKGMIFQRKNYD